VIHRGADVRRHAAQVAGRAVGVAQHDVDRRAHDGERGAQFMRGVGDEPLLALERGLEPARKGLSTTAGRTAWLEGWVTPIERAIEDVSRKSS